MPTSKTPIGIVQKVLFSAMLLALPTVSCWAQDSALTQPSVGILTRPAIAGASMNSGGRACANMLTAPRVFECKTSSIALELDAPVSGHVGIHVAGLGVGGRRTRYVGLSGVERRGTSMSAKSVRGAHDQK
jgi:hypothetical protein